MNSIIPIRALKDNYIWMIKEQEGLNCICVDPGEAIPVINTLNKLNLNLSVILITHHHLDHTGGLQELFRLYKPKIFAPSKDIHTNATVLSDNTEFSLPGINLSCNVRATPGHTLDHVIYKINDSLFTGDLLFSAGCGRIFEGTDEMMYNSLKSILSFPDETKIYCGHEYTYKNLLFAQKVDPSNKHITNQLAQFCDNVADYVSLPSILGIEKLINPFLRCENFDIMEAIQKYCTQKIQSPLDVFTELRKLKNNFN